MDTAYRADDLTDDGPQGGGLHRVNVATQHIGEIVLAVGSVGAPVVVRPGQRGRVRALIARTAGVCGEAGEVAEDGVGG